MTKNEKKDVKMLCNAFLALCKYAENDDSTYKKCLKCPNYGICARGEIQEALTRIKQEITVAKVVVKKTLEISGRAYAEGEVVSSVKFERNDGKERSVYDFYIIEITDTYILGEDRYQNRITINVDDIIE